MKEIISILTKREVEIMKMIMIGFKNCEIANHLFISTKTVEVHKYNIIKKLKLRSTTDLYCFIFKYLNNEEIKLSK